MRSVEEYIYNQKEPYQSIMLYIRSVIFKVLPNTEEVFRYRIPFYKQHKKPMLYLNVLKGTNYVDVAFVQGILLEEKYPQLKNDNNRKQVRSLKVKSIEDFNELLFTELLIDAANFLESSDKAWFV